MLMMFQKYLVRFIVFWNMIAFIRVVCRISACSVTSCSWSVTCVSRACDDTVEALCYKLEAHRFDSRWCYWNFSLTKSFRSHYDPRVDSAFNRNEYYGYLLGGKGGWCIGLTTLPPSCADHLGMI
jgi:hypothetical protein